MEYVALRNPTVGRIRTTLELVKGCVSVKTQFGQSGRLYQGPIELYFPTYPASGSAFDSFFVLGLQVTPYHFKYFELGILLKI